MTKEVRSAIVDLIKQMIKNKQGYYKIWERVTSKEAMDNVDFKVLFDEAKDQMEEKRMEYAKQCVTTMIDSVEDEDVVEGEAEDQYVKSKLSQKNAQITKLQKALGEKKYIERILPDIIQSCEPIKFNIPKKDPKKYNVTTFVHFSDFHLAERIEKKAVLGRNEYSFEIAKQRVEKYSARLMEEVELQRKNHNVNELVIGATGDMLSGALHIENLLHNEEYVTKATVTAGELIGKAIEALAPSFEKVRVEWISSDNHGRTSLKPMYKMSGETNYSYILGHYAKNYLRNEKNIKFNVHEELKANVNVNGRDYLLLHGHTIRGMNGIPYGAIDKEFFKEVSIRSGNWGEEKFDKIVMGHYHTPVVHQHCFIGGSLIGSNEYDLGHGRNAPAIQTFWFVHPSRKEYNYNEVILN